MRIKVPITGEVIEFDPKHPELASGNSDNPVRPLDLNKLVPGLDFAWRAIEYDFVTGIVELEITFLKKNIVLEWRDETDEEFSERVRLLDAPPIRGRVAKKQRKETDTEFNQRRANGEQALRDTFEKKTANELYAITKEPILKKPRAKLAGKDPV